jgi:TonB family protein
MVPAFPEAARHAGIEGSVIIQVDIDEAGLVKQVAVVQGLGYGCDESALNAVRGARFSPARIGDQPVPVRVRIPFRFQFQ